LRNEDGFEFLAAFRLPEYQFPVLDIHHGQFENFTDPHPAPCHQFQDQPIPNIGGTENNFIDGFFLNDIEFGGGFFPKKLLDHGSFTGIVETVIDVVADKIEKRCQLRESDPFGVGLVVDGQVIQKFQDGFCGQIENVRFTEKFTKMVFGEYVRPDGIFF
jgi:hypothetical protein